MFEYSREISGSDVSLYLYLLVFFFVILFLFFFLRNTNLQGKGLCFVGLPFSFKKKKCYLSSLFLLFSLSPPRLANHHALPSL